MAAAGDAQQDAKAPPVNRFSVTFVQQNLWREVPDARQQQGDKSAPKKKGGGGVKKEKKKGSANGSLGRAAERVRYCSRSHALFGQSEVGQADVACDGVSAVGVSAVGVSAVGVSAVGKQIKRAHKNT
jgi:hypothetical protein